MPAKGKPPTRRDRDSPDPAPNYTRPKPNTNDPDAVARAAVKHGLHRTGLTKSDLAHTAGIDPDTLGAFLNGKRSASPRTRQRLAAVLGLDPSALAPGQSDPSSNQEPDDYLDLTEPSDGPPALSVFTANDRAKIKLAGCAASERVAADIRSTAEYQARLRAARQLRIALRRGDIVTEAFANVGGALIERALAHRNNLEQWLQNIEIIDLDNNFPAYADEVYAAIDDIAQFAERAASWRGSIQDLIVETDTARARVRTSLSALFTAYPAPAYPVVTIPTTRFEFTDDAEQEQTQ